MAYLSRDFSLTELSSLQNRQCRHLSPKSRELRDRSVALFARLYRGNLEVGGGDTHAGLLEVPKRLYRSLPQRQDFPPAKEADELNQFVVVGRLLLESTISCNDCSQPRICSSTVDHVVTISRSDDAAKRWTSLWPSVLSGCCKQRYVVGCRE